MSSKRDSKTRSGDHVPGRTWNNLKGVFRRKKGTSTARTGSQIAQFDESSKNLFKSLQPPKPDLSAQISLDGQNSKLTVDQGRDPSQIEHGHNDDRVGAKAENQSKDLWMRAYSDLKDRDQGLVATYERYLASDGIGITTSAHPTLDPGSVETIVKQKLQDHEAKQWVIHLGTQPIQVRRQGEKIIRFILWSNDIITAAVNTQPYAALAWSGVSILLTLLLKYSQQVQAMADGLNSISDLLRWYRIKETLYLQAVDRPAHPDFVQAVVELYSKIFEYQARLLCFLSQRSPERGFRGILKLDDWESMLKKVQTSDNKCTRYCELYDRGEERRRYEEESCYMLKSVDIQKRVLKMLETSQAQRHQDRRDDQEAELLETLASDYKSDKDLVSTRVPGTCEWFFEDDRFLEWRDSNFSRLLWVSAGPGCGKSVLARALIDERRVCTNTMASTVCYFFFKDGQEQRTCGANALGALLHQLFENTTLITHALSSYRSYGIKLRDAFSELWEILVKSAEDSEAGEIICVLDALDECEKNARNQLIKKLVHFFSQGESCQNPSLRLKFLVTSRPYDDLEQNFQRLSGVSTYVHFDGDDKSQKIGQEINLVIDARIPYITGDYDDENRKRISNRLKEMGNRTYLWLFLIIDIIEKSPSNFRRMSSIDSLLSDLPSEVSDAYEIILSRSKDEVKARILLQLIVAATRPLILEEANMALTIATRGESCRSQTALELWPLQSFTTTVQNMCGLFVSVHDGKLSLIHQTAREFLIRTSKSDSMHSHKWKGCLDMATAHGIMSRICLDYLNFQDVARTHQSQLGQGRHGEPKNERYLLDYAANNWATHYTSQPAELAKGSQKAAKRLCNPSSPQGHWLLHYCDSSYTEHSEWTELGIASLLGLTYVAEGLLNEGADVNAQGGYYGNALQAASYRDHDRVVQLLLDEGADVNAQGGYYGNALQAASYRGHGRVVQILLDKGADINAQCRDFGNALQAASLRGHDKVVQMLLENGVDVNAQSGYYGNALQAASYREDEQIVQWLLKAGADPKAEGGEYNTALQAASIGDKVQILQLLLQAGADVNAQGGNYGTALQEASAGGNEEKVRWLLARRANPNVAGGNSRAALQAASFAGHEKIVQLLLEAGADPNAESGDFHTALQAASFSGNALIVQRLLEARADVNAQGGSFDNPLEAALINHHEQVEQQLLKAGARGRTQSRPSAHSGKSYRKTILKFWLKGVLILVIKKNGVWKISRPLRRRRGHRMKRLT